MKKIIFALTSIIFLSISIFIIFNIVSNEIKTYSLAAESAIAFAKKEYPQYDFSVSQAKRNRDRDTYYIDLKVNDPKYSLVKLRCSVMLYIIEGGYYRVKFWSTTNADSLTPK